MVTIEDREPARAQTPASPKSTPPPPAAAQSCLSAVVSVFPLLKAATKANRTTPPFGYPTTLEPRLHVKLRAPLSISSLRPTVLTPPAGDDESPFPLPTASNIRSLALSRVSRPSRVGVVRHLTAVGWVAAEWVGVDVTSDRAHGVQVQKAPGLDEGKAQETAPV